ncbi:MAG: rRNA maturation RNase YbeY [Clostridiales bacterium]|nr:rRNA maturation RNase YbeY [Clostridiales bacterium]
MSLVVDNRQDALTIDDELLEILEKTVTACFNIEKCDIKYEVSLSFVDNIEISELNYRYRDKQGATDVLSFPMNNGTGNGSLYQEERLLGDIVISTEKAIEQANEYGHSVHREIAFLTVHSMFHLMGYNHENKACKKEMRVKEEEVLNLIGLKRE